MNIVRMATISPRIVGQRNAMGHRPATRVHSDARSKKREQHAPPSAWRRVINESYPIAGMALLLAYFVRTLLASLCLAD